jgi:hypothetical protein
MTNQEFKQAFKIAESDETLTNEAADLFNGFGLNNFKPVFVTLRQVAELMRWQAKFLNGTWDMDALNEIGRLGRYRFKIIGKQQNDKSDTAATISI